MLLQVEIHGQKLPPDIYPEYDGKLGLPEAVEEDPTSSNPLHLLASSGGSFKYEQLNTSMFADATILKDFVYHVEFDYMRYRHDADWLSKQIGRYSFRRGKLVEQPTTLENMSKAVYSEESKRWRFCIRRWIGLEVLANMIWEHLLVMRLYVIGDLIRYGQARSCRC